MTSIRSTRGGVGSFQSLFTYLQRKQERAGRGSGIEWLELCTCSLKALSLCLLLQEVGDEITVWYDQNLLQGNFKKYQTITFGSDIKYPDKAINVKIGLEDIDQKDEMRLLGVLTDSDLNFSKHIAQV